MGNLTLEYVIVLREATDAMQIAVCLDFMNGAPKEFSAQSSYQAALSAAPKDHGLIAVNAGELAEIVSNLHRVVDCNPMTGASLNPIINDISKMYRTAIKALEQKQ